MNPGWECRDYAFPPSVSSCADVYYQVSCSFFTAFRPFITHSLIHSLIHSLTHSHTLTHSLTYSFIHSLTHTLTHSYTHSFTHLLIHTLTHTLTHSLTYLLICFLLAHTLAHLLHSLTQSSSHSFSLALCVQDRAIRAVFLNMFLYLLGDYQLHITVLRFHPEPKFHFNQVSNNPQLYHTHNMCSTVCNL